MREKIIGLILRLIIYNKPISPKPPQTLIMLLLGLMIINNQTDEKNNKVKKDCHYNCLNTFDSWYDHFPTISKKKL